MIKKIIVFFLFFILHSSLFSYIIWEKEYNGGEKDNAEGLCIDNDGNIYITGSSYNGINYDIFTIKYDNNGNIIWTNRFNYITNDYGYDISLDNFGNVYVVGSSYNGTNDDCIILKYSKDGISIWTERFDGGNSDSAYGITIDKNNYLYIIGSSILGLSFDIITLKYDSNGNSIWTQRFNGGNNDYGEEIYISDNNYIYVTGSTYNGLNDDYIVIKYDNSGNSIWTQFYDNGSTNVANGIYVDKNENIYVIGYSYIDNDNDFLLVKYDQNGNLLKTERYNGGVGNDYPINITGDNYGNIYLTGYIYKSLLTSYAYCTLKYDSNLNLLWSEIDDRSSFDGGRDIAIDTNGYLYITGWSVVSGENDNYKTFKYEQPPYPSPPDNISAIRYNNYIKIEWNDNTINERGYKIYRSYDNINFNKIGEVSLSHFSYTDSLFNQMEEDIYYKISATNFEGEISSKSIRVVNENLNTKGIQNIVLICKNDKIIFYNLIPDLTIEIFTLTGKKIKEFNTSNFYSIEWNKRDNKEREIVKGLYIVRIVDKEKNSRFITFLVK